MLSSRSRSSSMMNPSVGTAEMTLSRMGWKCTNVLLIRHCESINNENTDLARAKLGPMATAEELEEEIERLHSSDPSISTIGKQQAAALRSYFAQNGYKQQLYGSTMAQDDEQMIRRTRVVCSPMLRCLLSTRAVQEGIHDALSLYRSGETSVQGFPINVVPLLHESDGCYETLPDGDTKGMCGLSAAEVTRDFSDFHCPKEMECGWYQKDKKETPQEFLRRMEEVEDWLWREHMECTSCSNDEVGSLVVVTHGNLISALLNRLVSGCRGSACGSALFMSNNTGVTHVQLWTSPNGDRRLPILQSTNRTDHLRTQPELLTGNRPFDDSWVQEFLRQSESIPC